LLRLLLLAICLLLVDAVFTLVCVVPLIACWSLVVRQEHHAADMIAATLAQGDRDLRILAEGLAKTRLVRGYQMESYEQEQFQKSLERFQKSQAGALQQSAWGRRGMRTVIAAAAAFVALYLGWRVLLPPHATALASGIVVLAGFIAAWPPLKNLSQRNRVLAPATKAASQIQDYLNQIPEVGQAVGARFLQPLSRLLTFENVSYGTATHKTLLDELQFKIPAGRQVAIVSTDPLEALAVACLIPRFIEPQQGKILIDGEDIAWVTLDSLRAEAILVGGKDPFISGSVRDNISGGNAATSLNEITEAAKESHAHNFIQRLPQGYETIIGAQGEQLDAGQSFRLGLARALLRKPALLIVEEPDVVLDEDTKSLLDDAYKRISQSRTVLFIPRRLSTLRRCEEIVFIHQGKLAAIGPRDRLVKISPLYRHWEYLNFNEFRHEFETGAE
ncbi:MAG: ABC transporter ATP-binding protein, partial [Planctomycetota bacterium]|nr:ABC transporter ATP-binding protein [Planctomycetota bacterium]